jgi:hypothetical protein
MISTSSGTVMMEIAGLFTVQRYKELREYGTRKDATSKTSEIYEHSPHRETLGKKEVEITSTSRRSMHTEYSTSLGQLCLRS